MTTIPIIKPIALNIPRSVEHNALYSALYSGKISEYTCDNLISKLNRIYGEYSK